METKQTAVVVCLAVATLCTYAGPILGATPATTLEEFRASLDSRVFQAGGYGPWPEPLGPIFDEAALTYNLPRELLVTLAYFGSAFENRGDQPTIEYGYGVMALRDNPWGGDSLAHAARLLNQPADVIKVDPRLNILGAAAVLDAYANEAKLDRTLGLDIWLAPVIRYAGLDAESSRIFAMEIFSWLKRGMSETNTWGETLSFTPQPVTMDIEALAPPPEADPQSTDYGPAAWDAAPTCNYTAVTCSKDTIIIHTAEGSYAGCISWINNCDSEVSAHYVIAYDGRITQMVREYHKAWHVGCYNERAIGYEHEGYASASSHPTSQYNASADLSADVCNDWGIPKQKRTVGPGILGHIDVTNCCCGTHTDPGNGWDWTYYINRVNGTTPTPAWAATYTNHSCPSSIEAGTTAIVWTEFRNDGTSTWTHCATKLGTSGPQDRTSPFCTPANWRCADGSNPGCNRPTDVDQSSVAQGAVGRFTFIITAPATPGTYTEKFRLVQEGVTWFGPEITWTITVTASQGTLTGTVRNASNSAAIAGATVTVTGVGSTTTNSSGVYTFSGVNAGTYSMSVSATGFNPASGSATVAGGQTTTKDFSLTPADTQAPTVPTNLTANATSATTVALSWTASTDNVGVTGYDIQRDGSTIGSSTGTTYTDTGATPDSTLTYKVRAKDAVPNYSAWSSPASARTPPAPPQWNTLFSDGFNGSLNNWTQSATPYSYSTTVSHGGYTGAGAAYFAAGASAQMYRTFARPFAQGKVSGYFYDGKGGWKASVCGNSYRQCLSMRDLNGAAKMYIDNEFYNAPDNSKYYYRLIGGGGITHTVYATRDANTDCNGAWVYFETTMTPGAVGASPTGTILLKVTDRAGTSTTTVNATTDFFDWGIGRITLGQGITSTNEGYWDDIAFSALPPDWPIMGAPTGVTSTGIQWNFSPRDNNFFGWDVADGGGAILSPQYAAAGWLSRAATSWVEGGLTPNTQYTRKVRAWNGTLNSAFSLTAAAYTLSVAPGAGSVAPDNASACVGDNVIWTAVGGFGAGKVQYYKYAWNQSPTHAFTGSEPNWSSGTIVTQPTAAGTWYLHVQGFNGENVANGTCDYALSAGTPLTISQQPAAQNVCVGATAQFTVAANGAGLSYQWQEDGSNLSDDAHYSGVTTSTLTITNVDGGDAAGYRCVITGACGSVTSDAATLTLASTLAITQQPAAQYVCAGGTATFAVTITGDPSPTYQWQKDGANLSDGGHYSGAAGPTLTVAGVDESDVGDYRCVVSGGCGSASSEPATLVLQTATTITQQPEPQNVATGAAATLTIVAAGTGALSYQWQKDGVDIPDATLDTLSLNPARRVDAGNYRCRVTSDCGTAVSNEAALAVAVYTADFDEDGDVDLTDFTTFQSCFNGPNRPAKPTCAGNADFDTDSDVDLTDFTAFQHCFNGPNRPPKEACPQQ